MFKYLRIAFRSVLANKRRSLFIAIAISIGATIMILTSALSDGVRENMVKNSFVFSGHVNVIGIETLRGEEFYRVPDKNLVDKLIKEKVDYESILYKNYIYCRVFNSLKGGGFQNSMAYGIDIDNEKLFKESVPVLEGSLDSIKQPYYAIIDEPMTKKFDLKLGDKFSVTTFVETKEYGIVESTKDFTVGAIIQDTTGMSGMFFSMLYISNETALNFMRIDENQTGAFYIYLKNINDADKVANMLEEEFKKEEFKKAMREPQERKIREQTFEDIEYIIDKEYNKETMLKKLKKVIKEERYEELEKTINAENFDKDSFKNSMRTDIKDTDFKEYNIEVKESKRNDSHSENQVEDAQASIEERLKKKTDGLKFYVTTWKEEIEFLEQMISTMDFIFMIIIGILMVIILMGISNTLIMSIKERTGEIGTLRAIGMQRPSVMLLFILEGIILGFFGSLIGILIGGSISLWFSFNGIYIGPSPISVFLVDNTLFFKLTFGNILSVIIFVVVVAMIASIYPSYKATKLKPVTAMQKE